MILIETSGFADQTPVIREQTLKAVAVLSPKLKPNIINESLIRHLAKLLSDPIPGIRTVLISNKNTIICMAKLAQYLDRDTRSKILVHGFSQMLKDPFPFARKAALMGISASGSSITNEDIAKRIIPSIGAVLLDQDKPIRTLAFDVLNVLVKRLREWSDAKIDTPPPDIGKEPKSESNGWSVPAIATSFLTGRNSSTKATPLVSPSPSRSSPAPPFASQTLSSTHPPLIPTTEGPRQTNPMNLRPDSKKKLVIRLEAENEWGSNWNEDAIFDDPTKSTFIDVNQLPKVNQVPKTQLDPGGGWDDKWSPERTTSKKEDIWEDWG